MAVKSNRVYAVEPSERSLRLLWDKLYDLGDQLDAANTTIKQQATTITTLQSGLSTATARATSALIAAGTNTGPGASPTGGQGGAQGGVDDGLGAQGCASAGADGHVAPGTPLTAVTAGQIVCGTANEYSALTAVTADQPTRDANVLQLLLRMIWHLNHAGFTAGRQKNPSGVISTDKLTVQISGTFRAYDVFSLVPYTQPLPVHMVQVFPAGYVAEPGTPD